MDIECAANQFDIDLQAWLEADDANFMHDIIGIFNNINRETKTIENGFAPRFEKTEKPKQSKTWFLVTDPCYIVDDENWQTFLDETDYADDFDGTEETCKIDGGVITHCSTTDNGDGFTKIGKQEITVDAGIVCIAEFSEKPAVNSGYITDKKERAEKAFEKACRI
jgi:hypothetical protein